MLRARRIYQDDFDLLHEGMRRCAKLYRWEIIARPSEADPDAPPDSRIVTLEQLGLGHLRPVPEPPEVMACETCVNRTNAPGDGPCVNCDLTFDGPESNYCAEADSPVVLDAGEAEQELDAFAAQSAAGLPMRSTEEDAWGEDTRTNAEVASVVDERLTELTDSRDGADEDD